MLNQPNLLAISSADGNQEGAISSPLSQASYYNFTCNLPRPCLDVSSIQLVASNIPQAQSNIPNTACMFWYYRLSAYGGQQPNLNNLYYNRLLPSTYKQEFVKNPTTYGWNRTFKSYKDLATELVKTGTTDLTFNNWEQLNKGKPIFNRLYNVPYIPSDINIALNTEINKFEMQGKNVYVPPTWRRWTGGTTYALGDVVASALVDEVYVSWVSLANGNVGHEPQDNPAFWKQNYNVVMANWDAGTNYGVGRYVAGLDGESVYVSTYPNATQNPNGNYDWDLNQTYSRYQVALDPNDFQLYTYINSTPKQTNYPPSNIPITNWILTTWSNSQLYPAGFIAKYGTKFYECLVSGSGNQPDVSPSKWKKIVFWTAVDMTKQYAWNRYIVTGYQDPNVAVAQGEQVESIWSPYSLYEFGYVVTYNGNNSQFANWDVNKTYALNDYVLYTDGYGNLVLWECLIGGTVFTAPGNVENWGRVYFEANLQNIGTPPLPFWVDNKTYALGDQVLFGTSYYQSIKATPPNINIAPTEDPTYWVPIRTEWKTRNDGVQLRGFAYMSNSTDFIQADVQALALIFPAGFVQPFNPTPKRLLNSVLGFTWNGVFSVAAFKNFYINPYNADYFLTDPPVTQILNRLRPVPIYDLLDEWNLYAEYGQGERVQYKGIVYKSLQDMNIGNVPTALAPWWAVENTTLLETPPDQVGNIANLATVFTADAYACLVYSSIIYVYTSIVGASSLDTSRNTNLLAITPMNAGNLGVAFSNQFVDNPLNKIAGDIHSVYIELRDEFGEPYVLSNNAVATFMLKVKYAEEIKPRQNT